MTKARTPSPEGSNSFPKTRWTVLASSKCHGTPQSDLAAEYLAQEYWHPILVYLQKRWSLSSEEAEELTQDFFARLCQSSFLDHLSMIRGPFRAYLKTSVDNFVRAHHRYRECVKRGGGRKHISLVESPAFQVADDDSSDEVLRKEWARSVLERALDDMKTSYRLTGKETAFEVFVTRVAPGPNVLDNSYDGLALQFDLPLSRIKNIIQIARAHLRGEVVARIRETVQSEVELQDELRELFR